MNPFRWTRRARAAQRENRASPDDVFDVLDGLIDLTGRGDAGLEGALDADGDDEGVWSVDGRPRERPVFTVGVLYESYKWKLIGEYLGRTSVRRGNFDETVHLFRSIENPNNLFSFTAEESRRGEQWLPAVPDVYDSLLDR